IEGAFREKRYKQGEFEFNFTKLHLLETVKSTLTKQIVIETAPEFIDEELIDFIDHNIKEHPGKTSIKFTIQDTEKNHKVSMYSIENGFTMNDEMAIFLNGHNYLDVNVLTA
ncbi:MAG: hypothetical protein H7X88_10245, partial [Gloeobacteraceae cyanobacterium ES-bin-316]|nr:hypothetical protein [Ferruginibacter sp.]